MGLFIPVIFKLLTPKVVNGIIDYVFKDNELDRKVKILEDKVSQLQQEKEK